MALTELGTHARPTMPGPARRPLTFPDLAARGRRRWIARLIVGTAAAGLLAVVGVVVERRRHQGLRRAGRGDDGDRPTIRAGGVIPVAHPGPADGESSLAGGNLGSGRARPTAPVGRVHLVQPDARAYRDHHPWLRAPPIRVCCMRSGCWSRCIPACCWPPPARSPWSPSLAPPSAPPGGGCVMSHGISFTSMPTSASALPYRTSCGPAPTSPRHRWRPCSGGACGAAAAAALLAWRIVTPRSAPFGTESGC